MPVDDMALFVVAGVCYFGLPLLFIELLAAVVSAVRDWASAAFVEEGSKDVAGFQG